MARNTVSGTDRTTGRHLSVVGWIILLVVYLGILIGLPQLLTRDLDIDYAAPETVNELWRSITAGVAVALVFVLAIISFLRWWRPVALDDRPVQGWVRIVPIVMLVGVVVMTAYGDLADKGLGFTALLLATSLGVGFGEELMFRGVGITVFRTNGFSEGKVALWSTIIFGLAHSTNLLETGPKALAQVVATIIAGYFLYLTRRWAGNILVPAILHGLWDFSLISNSVTGEIKPPATIAVLIMIILTVLLVVRRHRIEPQPAGAAVAR